jgi:hypothetical protein
MAETVACISRPSRTCSRREVASPQATDDEPMESWSEDGEVDVVGDDWERYLKSKFLSAPLSAVTLEADAAQTAQGAGRTQPPIELQRQSRALLPAQDVQWSPPADVMEALIAVDRELRATEPFVGVDISDFRVTPRAYCDAWSGVESATAALVAAPSTPPTCPRCYKPVHGRRATPPHADAEHEACERAYDAWAEDGEEGALASWGQRTDPLAAVSLARTMLCGAKATLHAAKRWEPEAALIAEFAFRVAPAATRLGDMVSPRSLAGIARLRCLQASIAEYLLLVADELDEEDRYILATVRVQATEEGDDVSVEFEAPRRRSGKGVSVFEPAHGAEFSLNELRLRGNDD